MKTIENIRSGRDRFARTLLTLILSLSVGACESAAQLAGPDEADLATLDERIRSWMEGNNVPGAIVAVASQGEMIHVRPYGLANVELGVPVTDSTVFEIGSVTKQFTAAAILLAVEEGTIDLDAEVHTYLPYLPGEWRGATIRHLLTHTSGIPDYEAIQSYEAYRLRLTPEEIIRVAHSRPMDFEPGMGYHYSNTGYFLLALVLEHVEEASFAEVLRSRIFEPLGMARTRMSDPEAIIFNRASGYYQDRVRALVNRDAGQTSTSIGAGGLLSTVHDLIRWDAALYGVDLLSAESKEMMWTPATLSDGTSIEYGFGWNLEPYREHEEQYHYGMTAGFIANITRFPDAEITVIAMANRYREDLGRVVVPTLHTFVPSLGPIR